MEVTQTLPRWTGEYGTLGWGIAEWLYDHVAQPDGDRAGEPFELTDEQLRFLLWWYAHDEAGNPLHRRGQLRRPKGWGKSPLSGALAIAELCGPVRGVEGDQYPAVAPRVILAGVSQAQTENTMSAIRDMLVGSPLLDQGIDPGMTRILRSDGAVITTATTSAASAEGSRPSCVIADETHHWTESNGASRLGRTLLRNLAKSPDPWARMLETTNAPAVGSESFAEQTERTWQAEAGRSVSLGAAVLLDSREPVGVRMESVEEIREAIRVAYGDAHWVRVDALVGEVLDPNQPEDESRRFYLNQATAASDGLVSPDAARAALADGALADGERIVLGFDGSRRDDSTVLVAKVVGQETFAVLGAWERPDGPAGEGWLVDEAAVMDAVEAAAERYQVLGMFSDVHQWEAEIRVWEELLRPSRQVAPGRGSPVGYDMRGNQLEITRAVESLAARVDAGAVEVLKVPEGGVLVRHLINARRRPNRWGVTFGKASRSSPHKVDGVAAMVLADIAEQRLVTRGKRSGKLMFMN